MCWLLDIAELNDLSTARAKSFLKIAAKEADETQYWLALCAYGENYPDTNSISNKLTELQKIINTILGTSKRKASLNEV